MKVDIGSRFTTKQYLASDISNTRLYSRAGVTIWCLSPTLTTGQTYHFMEEHVSRSLFFKYYML